MSMVQFFTAAAVNLVIALIAEGPSEFSLILPNAMPLLFLGIGSSGIAYTLQILGQKDVNPAAASIILSLESVFGVIGTALFLGKTLTPREYLGCAIVLVAVILSQIDFTSLIKKKKS
jgi:drug/metabolite transporter (DMT)-like permease